MKNYFCIALLSLAVGCGSQSQLDAQYIESLQATPTPTVVPTVVVTATISPEPVAVPQYGGGFVASVSQPESKGNSAKENKKSVVVSFQPMVASVVIPEVTASPTATPTVEATATITATPEITVAPTASPTAMPSATPEVTASPIPTATPFLNMVSVPVGRFQRDSNAANISFVSAFQMSEKEITRSQYAAMGLDDISWKSVSTGINDPMQNVNWFHALVFCNMLSIAENLAPVYTIGGSTNPTVWINNAGGSIPTSSNATWKAVIADWNATGYRLPTEMEWEWAAMGGVDNYAKAFSGGGNLITDFVWFNSTNTHPVGTKQANEFGLYDMSGNVWEWTWDWSIVYPAGSLADYRGAGTGTYKIFRGGSFDDFAGVSIDFRNHYEPYYRDSTIGFRVVRK